MLENIFEIIWWLWLFLLWIFLFDEAIKRLTTNSLKVLIQKTTNTLFKSIWTGTVATVLLQWSTAVALIMVSFVAAGVLDFNSAMWVILWANLWSSVVSVALGNLWLRFSFSIIAMPVIGLFSLLLLLCSKNQKLRNIFKIIVWLALVFLWLWYMNESMWILSSYIDFNTLSTYPIILFFLVWLLLTALIHSSSIPVVLILTAANSGLVDYRMWIMFILWSFLGSTTTIILGALWWSNLKKQVAYSHFFFNLFSTVFGFLMFPLFVKLLENLSIDKVMWLSIFAVWFKIITVLLILPILKYFITFIKKLFPKKRTHLWLSIENVQANVIEAALPAIQKDVIFLLKKVFKYILNSRSIDEKEIVKSGALWDKSSPKEMFYNREYLESQYAIIKEMEQRLVIFQADIKKGELSNEDDNEVYLYFDAISKIILAAKYMKDVSSWIMNMQYSSNKWILSKYYDFRLKLAQLYKEISLVIDWKDDTDLLERIITLMETIKITDEDFVWEFTWNLWNNDLDQMILSDAMHVNRYFYLSCLTIISSLKNLFLSEEHRKLLEKIE